MKKNRFIKIAAVVFTLCLITTCGISSTLAKYTTGGTVTDSARVAKFGVHLTMEGDTAFSNEYATDDTTYSGTLSVKSQDDAKVVAPGTSGSSRFAITGRPEVAVEVTIELYINDYVRLAKNDHLIEAYFDPTTDLVADDTFTLTQEYNPVIFTLRQVKDENGDVDVFLFSGTLQEVQAWLVAFNASADNEYSKNAVLDSEFELSWAWNFAGNDKADTYLGNLIAGENPQTLPAQYYSLNVNYMLEITVTQID